MKLLDEETRLSLFFLIVLKSLIRAISAQLDSALPHLLNRRASVGEPQSECDFPTDDSAESKIWPSPHFLWPLHKYIKVINLQQQLNDIVLLGHPYYVLITDLFFFLCQHIIFNDLENQYNRVFFFIY